VNASCRDHGVDQLVGTEGLADVGVGPAQAGSGLRRVGPVQDEDADAGDDRPEAADESLDALDALVVVEAGVDDRDVGDECRGQGDRVVRAAGAADDEAAATDGQKSRDAFPDPIVRVDDEDPKRDRPFGRGIRQAASVGQATPIPV